MKNQLLIIPFTVDANLLNFLKAFDQEGPHHVLKDVKCTSGVNFRWLIGN